MQRRQPAFLARRQEDAAKPETVEQCRDIGLTARQPVHRVGVDDVDAACGNGSQQRLHTGSVHRSRRLRCVCEAEHLLPALARNLAPALHQLCLDRLHVLFVRQYRAYIAHRFIFPPFVLSATGTEVVMMVAYPSSRRPGFSGISAAAPNRAPANARGGARDRGARGCDGIQASRRAPSPRLQPSHIVARKHRHAFADLTLFILMKTVRPFSGSDRRKLTFVQERAEAPMAASPWKSGMAHVIDIYR